MTNVLKALALLLALACTTQIHAQTAADEAAVKAFWKAAWTNFESGNSDQMWASYTDNASEISPDGSLTNGKKALRENWDAFMKMADEKPAFKYDGESVRFVTPDVALVTWDSEADIKIGGQQVGGKTKGMAVVHKINGQWLIEFDSLTPVMAMPEPGK